MNGPSVELTPGVAARDRSVSSPASTLEGPDPEGPARIVTVNGLEVPAWRAAVRKRRRDGKPDFILHAEKWR